MNRDQIADLAALANLATQLWMGPPRCGVIGLVGTLGAGKTTLVQLFASAAGIDPTAVTSPTFTLLQSYATDDRRMIHHLDAYRVADEDEFVDLGVDELFADPNAWTIVEWADRVKSVMPAETIWIRIEVVDSDRRRIRIGEAPSDL